MDAVLITLGILGFGAILISAYVFTVAARNYVSADSQHRRTPVRSTREYVSRSAEDRRKGGVVEFPLVIDGEVIPEDRRVLPDRREAAQDYGRRGTSMGSCCRAGIRPLASSHQGRWLHRS